MKKISILLSLLLVAALFLGLCACGTIANNDQTEEKSQNTQESNAPTETTPATTEETTSDAPEETIPEISAKDPIDIETIGGVVIVGTVGFDDAGWHIIPEQPLNITYEYFLDNPSVFPEQTRINLIDPKDDGKDKTIYLNILSDKVYNTALAFDSGKGTNVALNIVKSKTKRKVKLEKGVPTFIINVKII